MRFILVFPNGTFIWIFSIPGFAFHFICTSVMVRRNFWVRRISLVIRIVFHMDRGFMGVYMNDVEISSIFSNLERWVYESIFDWFGGESEFFYTILSRSQLSVVIRILLASTVVVYKTSKGLFGCQFSSQVAMQHHNNQIPTFTSCDIFIPEEAILLQLIYISKYLPSPTHYSNFSLNYS